MSSGGKGAAAPPRARVAIPGSVKKMIDDIKEITGHNYGDDEIYAMLKECSMDPNETAQKLLLLDAFHEVKKRRDRKRESPKKEPGQLRWMQRSQAQMNRGRGNYSPRPVSRDAGGGNKSSAVKENVNNHISEKLVGNAPLGNTQKIINNKASSVSSPITDISNCPSGVTSQSTNSNKDNNVWASGSISKFNRTENGSDKNMGAPSPSPSEDTFIGNADNLSERNIVSTVPQKTPTDFSGAGPKQHVETMQTASSRPSSEDDIRPQVSVPQKVAPCKEWKPNSTSSVDQATTTAVSYEGSAISIGSQPESQQTLLEKTTSELQKKLEVLHFPKTQQVVLPNHIHVPEPGKLGFCFGSFDASFSLDMTQDGSRGSDKSTPFSLSFGSFGEATKVLPLSNPTVPVAGGDTETIYLGHTHSHLRQPEDFSSGEVEVLTSDTYDCVESKQEVAPQCQQDPVIHTSANYNYGYGPMMLNGQLRPSEVSESQARGDHPGFLMHQSFDPMSYYAQFYRSGMENDGRSSPLNSAGAANKHNGNVELVSDQTSQSPQEGNAPLVMSTASAVPFVTQAAGVMQSSVSTNQQHLSVYRQPTGIHLPHYPPFIHYAPYYSTIYPPHAIPQYFSSGAFPQQPHNGNLYLYPHGTTPNYSIPPNEQGSNTPSSDHIGVPVSYETYSVPQANNISSSETEALNSTSDEEVKENQMDASEQQIEGAGLSQCQLAFASTQPAQGSYTGVFHPAHTYTAATVQPLLLQQSQPITIPIDMMGPTAGVYPPQLQQHAQPNWPSNH